MQKQIEDKYANADVRASGERPRQARLDDPSRDDEPNSESGEDLGSPADETRTRTRTNEAEGSAKRKMADSDINILTNDDGGKGEGDCRLFNLTRELKKD